MPSILPRTPSERSSGHCRHMSKRLLAKHSLSAKEKGKEEGRRRGRKKKEERKEKKKEKEKNE